MKKLFVLALLAICYTPSLADPFKKDCPNGGWVGPGKKVNHLAIFGGVIWWGDDPGSLYFIHTNDSKANKIYSMLLTARSNGYKVCTDYVKSGRYNQVNGIIMLKD